MVRPRRKSSKRKAHYVERPIFYEYMALRWDCVAASWHRSFSMKHVWFLLMSCNSAPLLFRRDQLGGLNTGDIEQSWEGATVEFLRGPMKGKTGVYRGGSVEVDLLGRKINSRVNVFDLMMV